MRAFLIILTLWAAGLGAAAQFGKISVLYDTLTAAYPAHTGVGIGLMVSIVGMVGLIFGTTAGLLVARIGPRRAILGALILGAGVSALQSLLPPYPVMMLTRVLEGFSHLAIVVVGPTVIAGTASHRYQGLAMTLWSSFFGVTYALLAQIARPLLALGGPQALFLTHAAWMALIALALAFLLPRDLNAAPTGPKGNLFAQHAMIYRSPFIAAPAMGFVFYTVIYVALLTLLPPMMPPAHRALVATGMPLISIAVSLTLGVWLLSRITAVRLVQSGFALAAAASLGLWGFWGQPAATAAALLLAAALGLVQGASFASIPQLNPAPDNRARAAGAIAQLGNLGTTTGTPLLALMVTRMGPDALILFILPFCLCGIAVHWLQTRRRLAQ
jgi:MFS transporter, DHA1 family, inner membrane transport protein